MEVRQYRDNLYSVVGDLQPVNQPQVPADQPRNDLPLYDRRLAVYKHVSGFIAGILREADVDQEALLAFWRGVDEVPFLFGNDMWSYCEELYRRAVRLMSVNTRLEHLAVGEERTRGVEAESAILEWFGQEIVGLRARFAPYMRLA